MHFLIKYQYKVCSYVVHVLLPSSAGNSFTVLDDGWNFCE